MQPVRAHLEDVVPQKVRDLGRGFGPGGSTWPADTRGSAVGGGGGARGGTVHNEVARGPRHKG